MKIKTTALIFALIMALQFVTSAQTKADEPQKLTKKQTTETVKAAERSEMPTVKVDAVKAEETPAKAGCCASKTEAQKEGSKEGCKGSASCSGKCTGNCSGNCKGHSHGDTKSSGSQGQTKATGDAGQAKSSKGCCHRY